MSQAGRSAETMQQVAQLLVRQFSDAEPDRWRAWDSGSAREGLDAGLAVLMRRNEAGRLVVAGVLLVGDAITAADLRAVPLGDIESSANLTDGVEGLPPLRRDPGMTPEEFSQLVAQHYRVWAAVTPRPASAMAQEYGVKLPTVHGWIREARLRGYLSAGRREKKGS